MHREPAPPPSKSADRLKEYLEIIKAAQEKQGYARRFDIYRRAGSEAQTDRVLRQLEDYFLVKGNKEVGYCLTEKGESWLVILRQHRDLVGVLTRKLTGDRPRAL
ncbi:MAG: hypothetical protein ACE14S_10750 [Candidatus Bathyarchaeia archaeon]